LPATSGTLVTTTSGTATSATTAVTSTNLAGGSNGTIPYQSANGTTQMLAAGTSGYYLQANGAAAPTWVALTITGSGGATASGSVTLTSASSGAQSITPTTYGQTVTLPSATTMSKGSTVFNIRNAGNYPLKVLDAAGTILGFIFPQTSVVIGLADNSTSAGTWVADNLEIMAITATTYVTGLTSFSVTNTYIALDSNKTLLIYGDSTNNLYGIVYDQSSQTWGSMTLIRSSASNKAAVLISSTSVLVVSCDNTTGGQAVVLSISGTTITVNSAATKTLSGTAFSSPALTTVGTSYIFTFFNGTNNKALALTVSGTTVTIGATELLITGTSSNYLAIYAVTSSVFLAISLDSGSNIYGQPVTVSGTTLTTGTSVTISGTSSTGFRVLPISSGVRWAVLWSDTALGNYYASIISVAGTTASASTVSTGVTQFGNPVSYTDMIVSGSKLIVGMLNASNNVFFNIITDTSGTASAGTALNPIPVSATNTTMVGASNNKAVAYVTQTNRPRQVVLDYSGASPTLSSVVELGAGVDNFSPTGFTGARSSAMLFGTTYAYNPPSTTAGNRSIQMAKTNTGYNAFYLKQAPAGGGVIIGGLNENWYTSSSATTWTIIQRLECATV
jgi:hypothetical protein